MASAWRTLEDFECMLTNKFAPPVVWMIPESWVDSRVMLINEILMLNRIKIKVENFGETASSILYNYSIYQYIDKSFKKFF